MLKKAEVPQQEMELVTIESLVPADHLLRRIDSAVDFEFIRERVRHLYCPNNGRPALDPVVLFKLLFIGYLFGIRSERQLMREVQVNAAYRWFLRMRLQDKVPDASTLSQNRRRRFRDSDVYQQIFDEIVQLACGKGLVTGEVLYTDSTHLKASAAEPATKEIKVSRTDPDSGYMVRDGKPKGFFYLDHRTVDGRHAIITDTHVTPANVHDSIPYLKRLDRQRERFGFQVRAVGVDAGYATAAICKGLEERDIYGVIGYRTANHAEGLFRKRQFQYDEENDLYTCPEGQLLIYRTTNREGYRQYHSDSKQCRACPVRGHCTRSRNMTKVITRHVWEASKERTDRHRLEPHGKRIYKRRKETVERSFADAKQLHGHRYARMRGLTNVREQCLLAAACQNMKKIALLLSRSGPQMPTSTLKTLLEAYLRLIQIAIALTSTPKP